MTVRRWRHGSVALILLSCLSLPLAVLVSPWWWLLAGPTSAALPFWIASALSDQAAYWPEA
jgi:hypothetical protein